jgi:hypothetical protein
MDERVNGIVLEGIKLAADQMKCQVTCVKKNQKGASDDSDGGEVAELRIGAGARPL